MANVKYEPCIDDCEIDESNRTACISCFMEKCHQMGMVSTADTNESIGWIEN